MVTDCKLIQRHHDADDDGYGGKADDDDMDGEGCDDDEEGDYENDDEDDEADAENESDEHYMKPTNPMSIVVTMKMAIETV